jgi:hypothetical protein
MSEQFNFDGYTVRRTLEKDRPYLEFLIGTDPYHRDRMTADFFLKPKPGEDAWAMEEETGDVVLYFKTSTAVRLAVQFRPTITPADRERNRHALLRGMRWIEEVFRKNGFREVIFDTEGPELRAFALRHLGFVDAASTLTRCLPPYHLASNPPATQPEAVGNVPKDRLEGIG